MEFFILFFLFTWFSLYYLTNNFLQGGSSLFHSTGRSSRQVESAYLATQVDLEQVYNGKAAHVHFQRQAVCPICGGTGAHSEQDIAVCPHCDGHGVSFRRVRTFGGNSIATNCLAP